LRDSRFFVSSCWNNGSVKYVGSCCRCSTEYREAAVRHHCPGVGQGSARLGQGRHPETAEEEALRTGISLGMSLIDTSGNYGNGRSEKLIGRAIAGQRDRVFLVSKVEANEVSGDGMARACQASLSRLGTNFLDLYLLHWPVPNTQFSDVVAGFEQLRAAGKIKGWGVSNFNVDQMEDLFRIPDGNRCATNQVPYSSTTEVLSVTF
jgi:diketogulonate reductase-like aldo/keto reductase